MGRRKINDGELLSDFRKLTRRFCAEKNLELAECEKFLGLSPKALSQISQTTEQNWRLFKKLVLDVYPLFLVDEPPSPEFWEPVIARLKEFDPSGEGLARGVSIKAFAELCEAKNMNPTYLLFGKGRTTLSEVGRVPDKLRPRTMMKEIFEEREKFTDESKDDYFTRVQERAGQLWDEAHEAAPDRHTGTAKPGRSRKAKKRR